MSFMKMPTPVRVLVVEDNPDDQYLLHRELKKTPLGEYVHFVSDPRLAVELLTGPDSDNFRKELIAIILDIHLPHMSGIELLQLVRAIPGMESFPVIIMTNTPTPEAIQACESLNALALIEKPVTISTFSKIVADVFHRPSLVTG